MKKYIIKPWKWTDKENDGYLFCTTDCPMGGYSVEKDDTGQITWRYCYDEWYDEESHRCDSIEEGKKACQDHFKERILSVLKEVK